MEFDSAKVQFVRPYIFDYVAGVLWLTALVTALFKVEHVHRMAKAIDLIAAETPHVKVPAFFLGFILAIAGVILPYCISIILKLPTLFLLNKLFAFQRKATPAEAKKVDDLQELAMNTVRRYAGIENNVSSSLSLLYLETMLPTIGTRLSATREEISFKAYVALPVGLTVGFAMARYSSAWVIDCVAILIGAALGLGSFFISIWSTNRLLDNSNEDIAIALLVADSKHEVFIK